MIICWSCINNIVGFKQGGSAWKYCNPFVIIEAILAFMIFKSINLRSKIINKLAKGCFFTFLLHGKLLDFIKIELFANKHFLIISIHIVISAIAIYIACYVFFTIYDKISGRVFNYIKNKIRLPEINI